MNKLQELLRCLADASDSQINSLYEVIVNERIHYIQDVIGYFSYNKFIQKIKKDAINEYIIMENKKEEINYIDWIKRLEQLMYKLADDELRKLFKQISWILNLTNCTKAQDIFDEWYKEMVTGTQYETLIQLEEGE